MLPSPACPIVGNCTPVSLADLGDARQQFSEPLTGDSDVLGQQCLADLFPCRPGLAAYLDQHRSLVGIVDVVDEGRAVLFTDARNLGDPFGRPFALGLDQQQTCRVGVELHVERLVDAPQTLLIDDLHHARLVAAAEHLGDRVAGRAELTEIRHGGRRIGRGRHELDRDLGDDAEHTLGADEQPGEVETGRRLQRVGGPCRITSPEASTTSSPMT